MKRFAPLLLIVFALAAVPAAFADDAPVPSTPSAPASQAGGHPLFRIRLEMLQIRLQLVQLRYRIVCHKQDSDKCTQFTQNVVDRLTKLDGNVQDRIAKNCPTGTTDERCDVLSKLDQKLQDVIANLGKAAPAPSSSSGSESGLDNAAGSLAGSTKP